MLHSESPIVHRLMLVRLRAKLNSLFLVGWKASCCLRQWQLYVCPMQLFIVIVSRCPIFLATSYMPYQDPIPRPLISAAQLIYHSIRLWAFLWIESSAACEIEASWKWNERARSRLSRGIIRQFYVSSSFDRTLDQCVDMSLSFLSRSENCASWTHLSMNSCCWSAFVVSVTAEWNYHWAGENEGIPSYPGDLRYHRHRDLPHWVILYFGR